MKPCKSTHKKTKGYGCGRLADERVYGICKYCKTEWILNTDEGQEFLDKALERAKKDVERENRQKRKEEKIQLTDWRDKLQAKVNEISRLIDVGQPCLARGYHANQIHGGHIFSRGSNQSMRYNLHNIHRQSAQSNHFQNEDGLLREGLINEYGEDYFEYLKSLQRIPALKYTNIEYHKFYKMACSIVNHMKRGGKTYDKEERIIMRSELNNALGIYDQEYCEFKIKEYDS